VLLNKFSESNKFIKEESEKALQAMIENVTAIRAINALVSFGAV